MLEKIRGIFLATSAIVLNYLSVYGLNYKNFLSDVTYNKGKKLVKNIKE